MTSFKKIGFTTARVVYRKKSQPGFYEIKTDCNLGCKCESELSKAGTPDVKMAQNHLLCFNDTLLLGLSGKECGGRVLENGPDRWVFEIDAEISEAKSKSF